MNRIYNYKPDKTDMRDKLFLAPKTILPDTIDLRPKMPPIVDQGQLGSCTANAIGSGLREYMEMQAGKPFVAMSRLWLYWQERSIEGTISTDAGAYLRDGMKVLNQMGCAPETDFPYDITKFTETPSAQSNTDAQNYKVYEYHRVMSYDDLKAALASGHVVAFGFSVPESFEDWGVANGGGILTTPDLTKEKILGGHAVDAVGYNLINNEEYIIFRNSWGTSWGAQGYGMMPKSYWDLGLVSDMWTATLNANPDDLSFIDSINYWVNKGIIDNPPTTWINLDTKIKAGTATVEDFQWAPLLFQKITASVINGD